MKTPQNAPLAKPSKKNSSADTIAPDDVSGLGRVVVRNEFYRDGYRALLKLTVLMALIIAALVVAIFGIINSRKAENRYFATTEDGRLIPMVSLDQPNLGTPALMSWVAQSATEVMTFGFNDYRRRLQNSSRNFTRTGWDSFTTALTRSRIIESLETGQQVVTAVPSGAPILESEGLIAGRYQWIVQIPLTLSYQAGTQKRTQNMLVTVVVVRVPRLESPNGVGIDRWLAVTQ
jgi:intracellular multiplication protein IcmL